jgi:hypothetical protein
MTLTEGCRCFRTFTKASRPRVIRYLKAGQANAVWQRTLKPLANGMFAETRLE